MVFRGGIVFHHPKWPYSTGGSACRRRRRKLGWSGTLGSMFNARLKMHARALHALHEDVSMRVHRSLSLLAGSTSLSSTLLSFFRLIHLSKSGGGM